MEESFVIQSSQSKILGTKTNDIDKHFDVKVELQDDPNRDGDDGIQWVTIKGKGQKDVMDAKKHIIALCNPELKEHISFPGFPLFLFDAFKERIKQIVQREFGVVLSVTDDGFMDISGSNIGVTMAISKIHHLHKLNRDKDKEKARLEAVHFDVYINKVGDSYQGRLKELSNVLKKEILNILEVPIPSTNGETVPKTPIFSSPSSSKKVDPEIIVIDDNQEDSIEVIDSSESEDNSDDGEDDDGSEEEAATAPKRIESDVMNGSVAYVLPPNFVIKEWIKANYEGTNDPTDYVNKNDMLQHFRTHFDLPDHPDLANTFFDKLAVRIFPQEVNYRSVRTKKTKSKQGKRRLICLRKRTTTDNDTSGSILPTRAASISPPLRQSAVIPPMRQPAVKATSPPRHYPQVQPLLQPQQSSALMSDWNSNRMGLNKPRNAHQPPNHALPILEQPWQAVPDRSGPGNAGLNTWINSAQPVPKPRTQPKLQRQSSQLMNSLAKRVSEMTNNELIKKPRPTPDPSLRHIIIDGSNVAMSHGNHSKFSCRGIALCARFFIERGHQDVTCFVPNYRKGGGGNPPSNDHYLLMQLEDIGVLKATPSRRINGQNIVCYDDRFIVELAAATNGVILSNDQYRDLMRENIKWRSIIEQQLLQFTIVGDLLMLPEDPLGRDGPYLEDFLMKPRNGRTTRPQQKVVKVPAPARPRQQAPVQRPPVNTAKPPLLPDPVVPYVTMPAPRQLPTVPQAWMRPAPIQVLSPDQHKLAYEMLKIFPERENEIRKVINDHPLIKDIEQLMNLLLINDIGT